jgi:hypothetical protein
MNTRFASYEAARILVPGLTFALLMALYGWAFLERRLGGPWPLGPQLAAFAFAALAAGMTMYARETPKRRKAFQENQPSAHLQQIARGLKGAEALSDDEARRVYFHLLNHHFPPLAHDKVFFFSTVYHIMVHIRRTTFWFGVISVVSLVWSLSQGGTLSETAGLVVFALSVWLVYALNIGSNKADRNVQESYHDQILWMDQNRPLIERLLRSRRLYSKPGGE